MKSWNEIRRDATKFAHRWKGAYDEKSQAQSFLKEFFDVFGVDIVLFNTFEHRVKFSDGSTGFADCIWHGRILVEMKSRGKDLEAAYTQALEYVRSLPDQSILPRAIVVSDFQKWRFYDMAKDGSFTEFRLKDLRKFVTLFGYMIGADASDEIREQDPVNRKAAEKMAALHDAMKAVGYEGHPLEVYLVRLLFCLFAEDTGIFKPNQFSGFVKTRTSDDGRDLAPQLALLFDTLNRERRLANLDETIGAFPYVNGGLFAESLPFASFSSEMRRALIQCGELDWSKISPAIFGAMFQGVMDKDARRNLGAHYTSEENILKLIRPLFLDELREEFDNICTLKGKTKEVRLHAFHDKIASLTFLDPACGCGNFLLIAYRELRRLEMDVLEEIHENDPSQFMDISGLCKVSVSQFHGIEIEAFPVEIAKVALWLMDHLCNMEVAERFGQYFIRIPIKDSAHIVCANALRIDWASLLNASVECKVESGKLESDTTTLHSQLSTLHFSYIMGNPPFIGRTGKSDEQQEAVASFFGYKDIDFVACWYAKASDLIQGTDTRCAFVSTNSITQGEQVAPIWKRLNVEIDFAYRTFKWHNEAKGVAAVHCVIIGFHAKGAMARKKVIYEGESEISAENINGYLVDAPDVFIKSRSKALCENKPPIAMGNMPLDGGNLIIEAADYGDFITKEPKAVSVIKKLTGSNEYINRLPRYCLWLKGVSPVALDEMPLVLDRVAKCREWRQNRKDAGTRKHAATPALFREQKNPMSAIIVPKVSSEKREYVPLGFIDDSTIVTDLAFIIPDATLYDFGILTSRMHMAWMRAVAGRLKSDYRYSKDIVYNNFIWPDLCDSASLREKISEAAQAVLDARELYLAADERCSLATLYDPVKMPPELVKAHAHLDALVDKAYGLKPSATDSERVALLFHLYAKKVAEIGL